MKQNLLFTLILASLFLTCVGLLTVEDFQSHVKLQSSPPKTNNLERQIIVRDKVPISKIQYQTLPNGKWQDVPLKGQKGFPLAVEPEFTKLRAIAKKADYAWLRKPNQIQKSQLDSGNLQLFPQWSGNYRGIPLELDAGETTDVQVSPYSVRTNDDSPEDKNWGIFETTTYGFGTGAVRHNYLPSRHKNDLLTVTAVAANTLSVQLRVQRNRVQEFSWKQIADYGELTIAIRKSPGELLNPKIHITKFFFEPGQRLHLVGHAQVRVVSQHSPLYGRVTTVNDIPMLKTRIKIYDDKGNIINAVQSRHLLQTIPASPDFLLTFPESGKYKAKIEVLGSQDEVIFTKTTPIEIAYQKQRRSLPSKPHKIDVTYGHWEPSNQPDVWQREVFVQAKFLYPTDPIPVVLKIAPVGDYPTDASVSWISYPAPYVLIAPGYGPRDNTNIIQYYRYHSNDFPTDASRQMNVYQVAATQVMK